MLSTILINGFKHVLLNLLRQSPVPPTIMHDIDNIVLSRIQLRTEPPKFEPLFMMDLATSLNESTRLVSPSRSLNLIFEESVWEICRTYVYVDVS